MTDTLVPDSHSPFAIPAELPTIEVVHPTDPNQSIVINAEDFDPTIHQRWSEKLQPAATKPTSDSGETSEPKKRGRAPKAAIAPEPEPKKRGRPKAATASAPEPEPKKRGRAPKSTSPTIAVPEPETPAEVLVDAVASVPTAAVERLAALEAMDASQVKAIAEQHGIPRPRVGGWKAAIPRIVAVEFPEDEAAEG